MIRPLKSFAIALVIATATAGAVHQEKAGNRRRSRADGRGCR